MNSIMRLLAQGFLTALLLQLVTAGDILFLAPIGSKSHKNAFMALIEGLAKQGHTVTFVTGYKSKSLPVGVTEISLDYMVEAVEEYTGSGIIGPGHDSAKGIFNLFNDFTDLCANSCDRMMKEKFAQEILSGNSRKPDVVLVNMLFNDCSLAFVHQLKVPFVYVSPAGIMPWSAGNLRYPHDPIYCPDFMLGYSNRMTFFQRLINTLSTYAMPMLHRFVLLPATQLVLNQHLGPDFPSVLEIERNYSLILLYNHFSLDYPRPFLPGVVEVGGMHVRDSKALPPDLEKWVSDSGEHGVVYFSLGSAVPTSTMGEEYRKIFIEAFSRIPQRVLWKWETGEMKGLPPNVRLSTWAPQQDLLGHPKVKVFITHGGLLSTMETTYHGVPVIGIPIFADQATNMMKTQNEGAGIMLTWDTLTVDSLLSALDTVLHDVNFKERVSRRAAITRDRDMHPRDKAVYWVEYVMRHKGAYHLQPASLHLTDIQYYGIDIALFVITLLIIAVSIPILFIRSLIKICFPKKDKKKKKRA